MRKEEWILPYIKQNARLFVLVIFLGAVTIFSAAFLMFTSGFLISKSATRPENILLVYVPIVAVRTFGIARSVSRYAERLTGHHIILKIVSDMRVRLYNMLEPASLMLSSRFRTGDMLGILAEDIEHLQDAFLKTIFPAVSALLLYAASVIGLGFFFLAVCRFCGDLPVYIGCIVSGCVASCDESEKHEAEKRPEYALQPADRCRARRERLDVFGTPGGLYFLL